jgi:hypothetical protein
MEPHGEVQTEIYLQVRILPLRWKILNEITLPERYEMSDEDMYQCWK